MKKIFMVMAAMVAFSASVFAANITKDIKVDKFTKLDVSYSFDVTVVKSSRPSVTITIDQEYEPYLVAHVAHGVLFIGIDGEKLPKKLSKNIGDKVFKAEVAMAVLNELDMSGASSFYCDDVFEVPEFKGMFSGASKVKKLCVRAREGDFDISGASKLNLEGVFDDCSLDASGASNVNIEGKFGELDVNCSGAAKIVMAGESKSMDLDGSGASKIDGAKMVCETAGVNLSGASSATVEVIKHLEVDLSGASKLYYNSSVGRLEVDDISGGASLKKR